MPSPEVLDLARRKALLLFQEMDTRRLCAGVVWWENFHLCFYHQEQDCFGLRFDYPQTEGDRDKIILALAWMMMCVVGECPNQPTPDIRIE